MWTRHLAQNLAIAVISAVVMFFLMGRLPGVTLANVLFGMVILRLTLLAIEAFEKPLTSNHWDTMHRDAVSASETPPPTAIAQGKPIRSKFEIVADALGVITFCLLVPLVIALFSYDFFSLKRPEGPLSVAIVLASLFLYAVPHFFLKAPGFRSFRIMWWGFLFVPALLAVAYGVDSRHPYLDPFQEDHSRLAAEQVLALNRAGRTVEAGSSADWVIDYAWELDKQGKTADAAFFFREGLRLDSSDRQAWTRLMAIDGTSVETSLPFKAPHDPLWEAGSEFPSPGKCLVGPQLENLPEFTVVIVRIGIVSDRLVAAVAYTIRNELDLPVLVSDREVPLPEPTRSFGLLTGKQWSVDSLYRPAFGSMNPLPKAPVIYLLLTEADIYIDRSNFVFSGSFQGGAIVSSARFGGPGVGDIFYHRTSKQTLAALIKALRIPASPDVNCVTTYTRSLPEFDAKGNRPTRETLDIFRHKIAEENQRWVAYRFGPGFFR